MEFLSHLSEKEYEKFVKSAPKTHFMQSYAFGQIRKSKGFIPHYVGMKVVLCSAFIRKKVDFSLPLLLCSKRVCYRLQRFFLA